MPKPIISAEEIQQAIINRIMSRQYDSGARLPSVRDLADELGANRNTVNKAYQMLSDIGIVESLPGGRKGFLVKEITELKQKPHEEFATYFYQQAVNLVWQALAAGMKATAVRDHFNNAINEVYNLGKVNIAFYECNEHDSLEMGAHLKHELGVDIDCALLDDLYTHVDEAVAHYDVIITTFHHLSEITERLKGAEQIVGIDTRIKPETMLRIARLPNSHIAVIATLDTTTQMLEHILYSYYPDRKIRAVTVTDTEKVIEATRNCDHLIVTHTCAEQVIQLTRREPDVYINFQVDDQSIQFLNRRIHDIQTQKTAMLHLPLASQG
ncbi:MAG: GntR family transcriptional regulator [Anaerolineaceae bacterium]|nr:GntR family transcriptional regulator [Anaerolineaceae bacterium]